MKRPFPFLRILSLLIIFLMVGIFTSPHPLYARPYPDDIQIQSEAFELELIRLVNQERISRGLHPLQRNRTLTDAARAHNYDMINNGFFSHTGSNGSSSADRACLQGYPPYGWGDCYVGENIAAGYSTALQVFNGWMGSSGHRANILNTKYREIGVGYTVGGSYGHYWTMDFGAQPDTLSVFINGINPETTTRNVTLTLTNENVSGWGSIGTITGVQLSEDPTFAGASWQSWAAAKSFSLTSPCNGQKTVYVKYTDGVKEITSNNTIVLNEVTATPCLDVSTTGLPNLILFEAGTGKTAPSTLSVVIKNINNATTINWNASGETWLDPVSNSGTTPATLEISLATLGAPAGNTVSAQLTVSTGDGGVLQPLHTITVTIKMVDKIHEIFLPVLLK